MNEKDEMIAFSIIMPSFSQALQKAKGSLFPFGIFHLLRAKKTSKDVLLYLIGVHPVFQQKGIHAIIFNELTKACQKNNVINCIRTPELTSNKAIAAIWKNFSPVVIKKRCTFKKEI